jgi:hypothetical protein
VQPQQSRRNPGRPCHPSPRRPPRSLPLCPQHMPRARAKAMGTRLHCYPPPPQQWATLRTLIRESFSCCRSCFGKSLFRMLFSGPAARLFSLPRRRASQIFSPTSTSRRSHCFLLLTEFLSPWLMMPTGLLLRARLLTQRLVSRSLLGLPRASSRSSSSLRRAGALSPHFRPRESSIRSPVPFRLPLERLQVQFLLLGASLGAQMLLLPLHHHHPLHRRHRPLTQPNRQRRQQPVRRCREAPRLRLPPPGPLPPLMGASRCFWRRASVRMLLHCRRSSSSPILWQMLPSVP